MWYILYVHRRNFKLIGCIYTYISTIRMEKTGSRNGVSEGLQQEVEREYRKSKREKNLKNTKEPNAAETENAQPQCKFAMALRYLLNDYKPMYNSLFSPYDITTTM